MGYIKGDDDRLASMVADRIVKNDDFRLMIAAAYRLYLAYKVCKAEQAKRENSEDI